MMSSYLNLVTIVLTCVCPTVNGATFVVTAPYKIYYDSEYTVSVSAHGVQTYDSVTLSYWGSSSKKLLHQETLEFRDDVLKTWGVVFRSSEMAKNKDPAVILEVSGLGEKKRAYIKFNDVAGYIFIQTDKPLYTPGQKVKFRVIALDEYQRFALTYPVKVDIKNPHSIVVDRMRYYPPDAFSAQEIDLPREATLGNWTITATYENLGGQSSKVYSRIFEVREYVLPRFTTEVDVTPKVITEKTEFVKVKVESKYVFGRFVKGLAEIQLGIQVPALLKPVMLEEAYSEELTRGKVEFEFNITKLIPGDLINEQKKYLFVNVTVTEKGTLETDTVEDDSTLIVKPFYTVSFEGSRKQFKPTFNYSLQARVTDAAGNPASKLNMDLVVIFTNEKGVVFDGHSKTLSLDRNGKLSEQFTTPAKSRNMTVKLSLKSGTHGKLYGNEFLVPKLQTTDNQYLQISVGKPLTKYRDGLLHLQHTTSQFRLPITVLFLSRGHLLHAITVSQKRDGRTSVEIPSILYSSSLPFMRVVAYYQYEEATNVLVSDSIRLPIQEVCKEELRLSKNFMIGPEKPKSQMDIFARGGSNMLIGLVAVDKAIFALSDDQGLTRESMFEQLASHDLGKANDDVTNLKTSLKSSGLLRVIFHSASFALIDPRQIKHHDFIFGGKTVGEPELPRVSNILNGPMPEEPDLPPETPIQYFDEEEELELPPVTRSGRKAKPVRKYFPESWLFEEHHLSSSGRLKLNVTLPDSLTTWSITAVGVSLLGAMCVSKPIEQQVQKAFYAEIRLPYKVTRLEEVKVKVVLVNHHTYEVKANVVIEGSPDICFSSNKVTTLNGRNSTHFSIKLAPRSSKLHLVKVIPLRSGKPTITVHAKSQNDEDIVEKKLYVVAEGQKMRQTLTFVLDPEAKHATFGKTKRKMTTLMNTKTLKSTIYKQRKQRTKINLAMPKEFIKGTESCKISAFGDIMGDIINYAVVKSKSLMDFTLKDAEEVIGDLGPTVHVLLYANRTGLITDELRVKGQQFIAHSILRLLNYRDGSAFRLTKKSPKATWLTAVAMKTLCHAAPLAFIDKESLIDQGFEWLLEQMDEDGSLMEEDWRLAKDSFDYKIMLSAEALIATAECSEVLSEGLLHLQLMTAYYLEQHIENISDVMVMAKVAYALTRFDIEGKTTKAAVNKLTSMKQTNNFGHVFWANETVMNEKRKVPFWYRKGAKASSIEATAFALLVYLHHGSKHIDAIADWLVTQRNHQGVFVGALDSMAAIQALSVYSAEKHGIKVDLSCKLRASKIKDFSHSFNFTEENAIHPKSLSNVPVGDVIDVITKGQGLGQMHVNVEYNVPIDENAKCRYIVTIQANYTQVKFDPDLTDFPLCMYCDVDCPQPEVKVVDVLNDTFEDDMGNATFKNMTFNNTKMGLMDDGTSLLPLYLNDMPIPLPSLNKTKIAKLTRAEKILKMEKQPSGSSTRRTSGKSFSYSRESLCIHVCIEHLDGSQADSTVIEIEMLTGYAPISSDVVKLEGKPGIRYSYYDLEKEAVIVRYDQLLDGKNCFTFRVVQEEEIRKPTPAPVYIKEYGNPVPSCVKEYSAPVGRSLHFFCANPSNINRGECRCFSGLCSACKPSSDGELKLPDALEMVCKADIGHQIRIHGSRNNGAWTEYKAEVLSTNKTSPSYNPRKSIILSSPKTCLCPHIFAMRKQPLYMLTKNVEKMVNQAGANIYRYILDEKSVFLSVAPPKGGKCKHPRVSHYDMHYAFNKQQQCEK